jgi:hypothetical protein
MMSIRLDTDPRLCVTDADCAAIERGDTQTPTDVATRAALTHCWLVDFGSQSLEVETSGVPDFDSTFTARCMDTGEWLSINGWLATVEPLEA